MECKHRIWLKNPPWLRRGLWGGKRGRFVILRFPLFCSVWGSKDTQMLGKTARKMLFSHPFLCVPQMLVETRTWEQRPHMLAGKARGKRQINPILPIYRRGLWIVPQKRGKHPLPHESRGWTQNVSKPAKFGKFWTSPLHQRSVWYI